MRILKELWADILLWIYDKQKDKEAKPTQAEVESEEQKYVPVCEISKEKSELFKELEIASTKRGNDNLTPIKFDKWNCEIPDPTKFIYIYMVGKTSFIRESTGVIPRREVPACPRSERYLLIMKLPDPLRRYEFDMPSEEGRRIVRYDAKRVAMDFCYPDNLTLDLDINPEELQEQFCGLLILSQGNDYRQKGLFWSENFPPTEDEIEKAIARVREPLTIKARIADLFCEHGNQVKAVIITASPVETDTIEGMLKDAGFKLASERSERTAGEIVLFPNCEGTHTKEM